MPLMRKKLSDQVQSKVLDRKFWTVIDGSMINDQVTSDSHRYEEDSTIADKDGIETETETHSTI